MNKRQAKIYALELAAGILRSSCDTLEIEGGDEDHHKIETELEHIADSLWKRGERLREKS